MGRRFFLTNDDKAFLCTPKEDNRYLFLLCRIAIYAVCYGVEVMNMTEWLQMLAGFIPGVAVVILFIAINVYEWLKS